MLRGATNVVIDDKGRWAMPKRYRASLIEQCQGHFVCTIDHQFCCLLLYPIDEWERIEAKLVRLSSLHPAERRLQRLLLGHASECELDAQGRILIPPTLRQYAQLANKIMVVGQLNKFEIWSTPLWQQQIEHDIDLQAEDAPESSPRLSELSL
ncbi:cell division protein MraZ [Photobacterium kishitanii]|uniref:Transcriptional regulator MraZ n=1 Tax=Photobacterium kishitanii TaxID=318456 RepID=A0AAX0YYD0_9GAMM|nr:division/cell wall cluster transcriptional repressor MraZ [Photobacterium kishitanii]KJG10486.1 cell division protein MraZ [Photobacterium kishitanii]KJG57737.1 cell division protein MraZ [Photobacterium kishitanii]KJG61353.1 cell division protein MraZ [Photobacterium kishitanii]KJG65567.1 cell division protein MraZ [Photobacterium kishitanii]KJG70405.1 cell division protein MraZ [Photobacterium kishitanii]